MSADMQLIGSSTKPTEKEEEKKQGNRDSPIVFYHEFELNVDLYGRVCDRRQERESRPLADVAETLVSDPPLQTEQGLKSLLHFPERASLSNGHPIGFFHASNGIRTKKGKIRKA
jgi:hypothetical protein